MPAGPQEAFNALVYQTMEAAAALLEAGRPAEALRTVKNLAEMEITARQREQYIALRREIESQLVTDSWVALQLAHPEPLTFALLTETVIPYLQALHRLHEVVARLQGKPPAGDPEIRQLSHHSPFSITFGFWYPDIIKLILGIIFDERRGPSRRRKAGQPPAQPWLTRVDTTHRLLEEVVPDASTEQKAALANRLLPDVDLMASSVVEAQVIGVSVRRDVPAASSWEASEAQKAPEEHEAQKTQEEKKPEETEEETRPAPPESGPHYIGGPAQRPPYTPRRRMTRPAPKPFSPPDDDTEEKGSDSY